MLKGLSMFANVGIAETYFHEEGIDIVVANELLPDRAKFYEHLHPNTKMICGDITDKAIFDKVLNESLKEKVDFIMATPPCQGMSLNGKKDPNDKRNYLIIYAVEMIKEIKPKYVLLEIVPQLLKTNLVINKKKKLIPEYIHNELDKDYNIKFKVLNTMNFGVPQSRSRCFTIMVRKDVKNDWDFPAPEDKIITLREAIGDLPSVEPLIREDGNTAKIDFSNYHYPPVHSRKHVEMMKHTPTGKSAFENEYYYPKKDNGERIKGGAYAYMRMSWDKPAPTITQNNGVISSFTNVHPGRLLKDGTYSDPRVLTIKELLIVTSLPLDWSIPSWASEQLVRKVIGEAIPPLITKKIVANIGVEK